MRVGWLHHNPGGYVGGAELTMAEFAVAAPDGAEVITIAPAQQIPQCDRYVIGNWQGDRPNGIRYLHDMRGGFTPKDTLIFCSPLQRTRYGNLDGHVIPPAVNLKAFRPNRQTRRNGSRKGAVALGAWHNPGKGQQLLNEWSVENDELLHVYGEGQFIPTGPNIDYHGALDPAAVPQTLWAYNRFVHLPTDLEPFGRSVIEAAYAGCGIITNDLVGANHYIENDPDALENAAERFWSVVLD